MESAQKTLRQLGINYSNLRYLIQSRKIAPPDRSPVGAFSLLEMRFLESLGTRAQHITIEGRWNMTHRTNPADSPTRHGRAATANSLRSKTLQLRDSLPSSSLFSYFPLPYSLVPVPYSWSLIPDPCSLLPAPVEKPVENFCQEAKMKIVCNSLWNQRKKLCPN